MDDNNFQNSLCITSMKQKVSGLIEAHGPFISRSETSNFALGGHLLQNGSVNINVVQSL